jgi:hypothetical protein
MFTIDHDELNTIYHLLEIAKTHIQEKRDTAERWTKVFDCEVDAMLRGVDLMERLESELIKEAA